MAAGATLCCALLVVGVSVSAEQEIITAESGQVIVLPCRAPNNNPIRAVVWAKPALQDEHVYMYRDGRFDPEEQNPIFKNRVELQDSQMKGGDVSLVLKDVTAADAGTYECRVVQRGASRSIKAPSVNLVVAPPGQPGGDTEDGGKKDGGKEDGGKEEGSAGLIVGLSVCAVLLLLLAVVGMLIYRTKKQKSNSSRSQTL